MGMQKLMILTLLACLVGATGCGRPEPAALPVTPTAVTTTPTQASGADPLPGDLADIDLAALIFQPGDLPADTEAYVTDTIQIAREGYSVRTALPPAARFLGQSF